MIVSFHRFVALIFCGLISTGAFAEAPVVDDSENFAMLDQEQAAFEQSVSRDRLADVNNNEEEIALARDTGDEEPSQDATVLNKVKGLQQEIQELRGQLEVQSRELKLLQQQQLSFYKDLDSRINNTTKSASVQLSSTLDMAKQLEKTNNPPPKVVARDLSSVGPSASIQTTPTGRANPADEQVSYLAAYDLVKSKQYDEALNAMQTYVIKYPKGGYTANAQYWLGELYMTKKNYAEAIKHFETVLKYFPTSSKAPASSLKIGYALASSGKESEAKQRLQQVIKNFPDTTTAQLASTKLRTLNAS